MSVHSSDDFLLALPPPFTEVLSEPLELHEPFIDLVSRFADEPGTVALLSGGEHDSARYHLLALRPWLSLREHQGLVTAEFDDTQIRAKWDAFAALEALLARYALANDTLPNGERAGPLSCGLLGYLAYDLKDLLEDLPRTCRSDSDLPRFFFVAPSILIVHDRQNGETTLHVPVRSGHAQASASMAALRKELSTPVGARATEASIGEAISGLSREEYMRSVAAIRDYIARGHVYQVNMSQRFEMSFQGDAFVLFAQLFQANPASFFAFVQAGDHQIVSSSPERFIELRGRKAETRPIKGTRPRGKTPEQDLALREDLETSPKDDSELSMIVDLLRNDLGRVCAAGSVQVVEHKRVEAYANVHHLVSVVTGELDAGAHAVDLLKATFPGGSITGCPKIRAMEVIDELEPVRRHAYTGSIGYLGFEGSMDFSIAIRTAIISNERLVYSVGGGVVYDSDPADEYEETLHKGRTLSDALKKMCMGAGRTPDARIGWLDGKFLPLTEMKVGVEEEGFAYGYGFFETLRVEQGRILHFEAHVARFTRAWQAFFRGAAPDITWKHVIDQVLEKNGLQTKVAAVKLMASAGPPGTGARGVRLMLTARPYLHRLDALARPALRLAVYPFARQSPLGAHKTSNYMLHRVAADWAKNQGADEAILLDPDGSVSETNTGNLLWRSNGTYFTPNSPHALPGTMLHAVCDLLHARGTPVKHANISVRELQNADAVYAINSLMGVVPVSDVDEISVSPDIHGAAELREAVWSES